jgi:ABC-type transport system involved in multi-copper enzyme maturation permease subunit
LIVTGLDVIQEAHAAIACPPPDTTTICLSGFATLVRESPVLPVLSSLPLLLGAFIGAPLVSRELEQGTYLLAWTQGVSRHGWLLAKMAMLLGLSGLGFAGVAGLMAWWSVPIDPVVGPWLTFEVCGLVPFAYAFFALALGVAAGAIVRQVVAAMFATGAIFVAVRLAVAQLRPYFLPPLSAQATAAAGPTSQLWTVLVVQQTIDPFHKSARLLYQPSDRFWTFQGIEAAIFVALGLALLVLTVWWMRHHIA